MASTLRCKAVQVLCKQKVSQISSSARLKSSSKENNLLTSVFKDIPKTSCTVNEFVWQNLERFPEMTFTVCAVTGRRYTYAQAQRLSLTFAASLRSKLKLQNDDKVAIILPNLPEYPSILLGVLQAGCIASTMNPLYTTYELEKLLTQVECKAIVATKAIYANISEALKQMKVSIPVILVENEGLPEGTINFSEVAGDRSLDLDCLKSVRRSPDDVALLPFSSGTTGFPKAVELKHREAVAMNQMIVDPETVAIRMATDTYQAVLPCVIPFFHIFGLNIVMINQMYFGAKLVTLPYFKPEFFLQSIVQHKAEVLFAVPPMVVFLGKHPAVTPAHLASLEGIVSGAAPVSPDDAQAVIAKKKLIFRQGYGMTETNGVISVGRSTDDNHAAVGHVMGSTQVKIADINTQEALGPNQEGEIWFRGPNVMTGYYKNEEATREVFSDDGWYKTGDIGKYDESKYLYVTDRLKELIKVKGFQVPPAELEAIIRTHPKVLDCAVIGVPDPISGEVPKAFLVPHQGQNVEDKEIMEFVNNKVAVFKKIASVQFVAEIPKSAAGKILRKQLKEKYC